MWQSQNTLSTYHKVVRAIAGLMVVASAYGAVLLLFARGPHVDPVVKWASFLILVLMLFLSVLMFRAPSRGP